jgi:hypothetical protein
MVSGPKQTNVHAQKAQAQSAPNNVQSLSDPIILGINDVHNKLRPFSLIPSIGGEL